jgi:hypothetical protein
MFLPIGNLKICCRAECGERANAADDEHDHSDHLCRAGRRHGRVRQLSALQPEFQRLWTQSDSEAGFISGIYFVGYVIAVPLASGLTDRVEARRCT